MAKLYTYNEYLFVKEDICNCDNKRGGKFIFNDKLNLGNKLILNCTFDLIENDNYVLKTEVLKYSKSEKGSNSAIFYHNFNIKNNVDFNLDLITSLLCELNTTKLNETYCGFKDLNNNTLSLKLWKDKDMNYYAGISTSYYVEKDIYDYIIVGGGTAGVYSAYKIAQNNPESNILILEDNKSTFEEYVNKGYDKINKWNKSQVDSDFQKSYLSKDNKTIWIGKGLGGGTLHFGLQYVNNITKNYEEWKDNYKIIDNDLKPITYYYNLEEKIGPNNEWLNLKTNLDNFSKNNSIDVYNNSIYGTDYENRLLLGNLLKDLKNVKIIYGKKVDKIIFTDYLNNQAESVKTFDGIFYNAKNIILCAGALETPCILQRSNIDCGNKLYDHGAILGLAYGKLDNKEIIDLEFELNSENLESINSISKRYIFSVSGNNLPKDEINNIYDFTDWSNYHPGGSFNIIKWRTNDNNLVFPHNSYRWISSKSRFVFIGKKNEKIKFDNLPDNLKSEELYKVLLSNNVRNIKLKDDLGLEPNKIVSHLQTRDKNFNWQTYYSTVPDLNNLLILSHSQSINLEGRGKVKIKSFNNEDPEITLNHFGTNKDNVVDQIYEAYTKNHKFLLENGYVLLNPNPIEKPINKNYISNNLDSIYHYHGSCSVGEVVDNNQKVLNTNNLYVGDLSVLSKPWGGSTSYAALNTGLNVSKNFLKKI